MVRAMSGKVWVVTDGADSRLQLYAAPASGDAFAAVTDVAGADLTLVGSTAYVWDDHPVNLTASQSELTVATGNTVLRRSLPCTLNTWSIALAADAGHMYAISGCQPATVNQATQAYVSLNGGGTWSAVGDLPTGGYVSIAATNGSTLVATGSRMPIDVSRDGGKTWTSNFAEATASGFTDLVFGDGTNGFATFGGSVPLQLAYSTDGGRTWALRAFS